MQDDVRPVVEPQQTGPPYCQAFRKLLRSGILLYHFPRDDCYLRSSSIRRHKWGAEGGKGRKGCSPTRVLETLDLAKVMELGLKQR